MQDPGETGLAIDCDDLVSVGLLPDAQQVLLGRDEIADNSSGIGDVSIPEPDAASRRADHPRLLTTAPRIGSTPVGVQAALNPAGTKLLDRSPSMAIKGHKGLRPRRLHPVQAFVRAGQPVVACQAAEVCGNLGVDEHSTHPA
jgi:hypothetical protein